jgi:hypothetical protein
MKVVYLSVVLLLTSFAIANAQVNHKLEFFADEGLSICELTMNTAGLVKVHMVVTGPGNFRGISFKAPKPACMTNATWIADIWQQPGMEVYVGNTQQADDYGVDVVFTCSPLPRYLGWIWYNVAGPASSCCAYAPAPGAGNGFIVFPGYLHLMLFSTCNVNEIAYLQQVPAATKGLIVNPNETCRCNLPVATRQSTWGGVKALYR